MKLNNNTLTRFAPVVLLCAAIFGMAGCTQGEDALQGAGTVAQGGEPIHVSVAPKPGFIGGTGTRATVGDDGTFGWSEGTDYIYACITFNDATTTTLYHTWQRTSAAETHSYMTGWKVLKYWGGSEEYSGDLVWPLGANTVTVRALYTDCTLGITEGEVTKQGFDYSNSTTGDHMIFQKTLTLGEDLTVDFHHATTRLVFTGLKATTAYSLKAGGTALTYPTSLTVADFSLGTLVEHSFISDTDGKLVICAALDGKINASTHKVSLEVMEGDAASGTAELTAMGGDADGWKMDGFMYTVNFANGSGTVNPDSKPDLLIPAPIVANNTVYVVNGYYVTAPDADENKEYQWAANTSATEMDSDPCAGHGDWRMPTMKDFETMAGWTAGNPWSEEDANTGSTGIDSDKDAWNAAFPDGYYWSSVAHTSDSSAWGINSNGSGTAYYYLSGTLNSLYVRCVQPQ